MRRRIVVNMSRKYRNEIYNLEKQVEDMRNGLANIEKELNESKERVVLLRSLAVKYKKELDSSTIELTNTRKENKKLEEDNEELKRKLAELGVEIQVSKPLSVVNSVNQPKSDVTNATTDNPTSFTAEPEVAHTVSENYVSSSTHQDEVSDSTSNKGNESKHEEKDNLHHEGFKKSSDIAKIWTAIPCEEMQFSEMTRLRQQLKDEETKLKEMTENAKKELDEVNKKACSLRSLAVKYKKELEENYSELDKVRNQKEILEQENVELKRRLAKLGVPMTE